MDVLDRLIEILSGERGEKPPRLLSEEDKAAYFRALCNVRSPEPVSKEFLRLQDRYLSALAEKRGSVDAAGLEYDRGTALWRGDITRLKADAIVNACNPALLGCFRPLHNCIDNAIHSFAGVQVRLDCAAMMKGGEEPNGRVKVTAAYNLPSKYVFHTVGPVVSGAVTEKDENDLRSCYLSCLREADGRGLATLAFCCISTGVYGYPKEDACRLAVRTVREYLADAKSGLKVIFDVFDDEDERLYERELEIRD